MSGPKLYVEVAPNEEAYLSFVGHSNWRADKDNVLPRAGNGPEYKFLSELAWSPSFRHRRDGKLCHIISLPDLEQVETLSKFKFNISCEDCQKSYEVNSSHYKKAREQIEKLDREAHKK